MSNGHSRPQNPANSITATASLLRETDSRRHVSRQQNGLGLPDVVLGELLPRLEQHRVDLGVLGGKVGPEQLFDGGRNAALGRRPFDLPQTISTEGH